jgi:hypothetical protein
LPVLDVCRLKEGEREREAIVVVNKGGRKKNTDDSGISVGAVDVTAATEHAKKMQMEEGILDFYHFQKHEAQCNLLRIPSLPPSLLWIFILTASTVCLSLYHSYCW